MAWPTNDIQGNIIAGLFRERTAFLFLRITEAPEFRAWLGDQIPYVTNASLALADKIRAHILAENRPRSPQLEELQRAYVCMNVHFTAKGAKLLGFEHCINSDRTYADTLATPPLHHINRTDENVHLNLQAHVLIILASDHDEALARRTNEVVEGLRGSVFLWMEHGEKKAALDHLGFEDPVGQPRLKGYSSHYGRLPLEPFLDEGDPGHDWVEPSDLLAAEPSPENGPPAFGSYGVYWKFRQNPEAFAKFLSANADAMNECRKAGVGDADARNILLGSASRQCPLNSHVSKVRATGQSIKILRRGTPYEYPHEKGLHFVSYQRSLGEVFEVMVKDWMLNPEHPHPGAGVDALIGHQLAQTSPMLTLQEDSTIKTIRLKAGARYVEPLICLYLYAPGISCLAQISRGMNPSL